MASSRGGLGVFGDGNGPARRPGVGCERWESFMGRVKFQRRLGSPGEGLTPGWGSSMRPSAKLTPPNGAV